VKPAVAAAVIVTAVQLILDVLDTAVAGGQVDLVNTLLRQLIDLIGLTAIFGAVVAVFVVGATSGLLLRAGAVIYVANLVEDVLFRLRSQFAQIQPDIVIDPLSSVVFFLGFVMAYRIFQGETVLPGVDVRL